MKLQIGKVIYLRWRCRYLRYALRSFKYYSKDLSMHFSLELGVIHKLRLQDLSFFDHLPPSVYIFYGIKVLKKSIFWTAYPPPLVNVVCERPLTQYLDSTCNRCYYQIVVSISNALKIHANLVLQFLESLSGQQKTAALLFQGVALFLLAPYQYPLCTFLQFHVKKEKSVGILF